MISVTTRPRPTAGSSAGRYRFGHAARMEWVKLRTLRSTWWTLAITAAGTVGIGVTVGLNTTNASEDLTNNALAGIVPGLLLAGVLGVLTMTSEYTSGMIRATLTAIPRRPLALAAKAAVFGTVALAVGEVASFASFFAGGLTLRHGITPPSLGQPGVLRAVVLAGAGFCLIGLLGLGLGAIIRHTGAAIAVLVAGIYVAAQFVGFLAHSVLAYMPILIVGNSLSTTKPLSCAAHGTQCPHFLSAWAGLTVLAAYAAMALMAGGWLLARRDA
jgi:ABC-2 type transport system permease protein